MRFETKFNCGDKAWIFTDRPEQLTIGQIRIEYTKSKGFRGGYVDDEMPTIAFDNYKPKAEEYREVYMCVETGIGSGSLWELGKSIFATAEECVAANAKRIADQKRYAEEMRRMDLERAQRQLVAAQDQIARLSRVEAEE
jgi:hypothetical protein